MTTNNNNINSSDNNKWQLQTNLPVDLMEGMMQDLNDNNRKDTVAEMKRRIAQFVSLRHGVCQDDNFTFRSKSTPALCQVVAQALSAAAPLVRHLTLRLPKYSAADVVGIQDLLRQSPLLSRVELIGNHNHNNTSCTTTTRQLVMMVLQGLGSNPYGRFSRLELTGMPNVPTITNEGDENDADDKVNDQEAWEGIRSRLQILVLDDCGTEFVKWTCQGLHGAPNLARLTIRISREAPFCHETWRGFLASLPSLRSLTMDGTLQCRMNPAAHGAGEMSEHGRLLREGIPPLPKLRSLDIGHEVTKTDSEGTFVAIVLQGMPHLESLELPEYETDNNDFSAVLGGLTKLKDLHMGRINNPLLRTQCPSLEYLTCRPTDAVLDAFLLTDGLVSLDTTQWLSDTRTSALFQRLVVDDDDNNHNNNKNLRALTIRQGNLGPLVSHSLERVLQTHEHLVSLSLPASDSVVSVLARGMEATTCRLTHLHLEKIRMDISSLLRALVSSNDKKLSSLSLHFKQLLPETRTCLTETAAYASLNSLFVHFDGTDGTAGLSPDEFAQNLLESKSLVRLDIIHNAKTQPAWNIMTRFVSRRNRIRQWVQKMDEEDNDPISRDVNGEVQSHSSAALWPFVLEWLVPDRSTTFGVVKDIFWPLYRVETF